MKKKKQSTPTLEEQLMNVKEELAQTKFVIAARDLIDAQQQSDQLKQQIQQQQNS